MIRNQQLPRFFRFACVGIGNTTIHLCIVFLLVEQLSIQPPLANAAAFTAANVVSYILNSKWTFQKKTSLTGYSRFFLVSLSGLAISWGCVFASELLGLHYLAGVLMSVFFVTIIGYLLNRHFVFNQ
ncbi:GtrA family protein [Pseudomonas sp. A1437]|uniref:GtrA family protein n=1 Tax=unclassified Pseudomonas TaxID=196821 RepID=UPI00378302C3